MRNNDVNNKRRGMLSAVIIGIVWLGIFTNVATGINSGFLVYIIGVMAVMFILFSTGRKKILPKAVVKPEVEDQYKAKPSKSDHVYKPHEQTKPGERPNEYRVREENYTINEPAYKTPELSKKRRDAYCPYCGLHVPKYANECPKCFRRI